MVVGQRRSRERGQGMNWKAGDKERRLDFRGHFRVLARVGELGFRARAMLSLGGVCAGRALCISLGCAWG